MGIKKQKRERRLMSQYALSFAFRPPYQILLTSAFIASAGSQKMNLGSLLQKTLQADIKPMITQCSIRHLYNLPTSTPAEKAAKDTYISVAKQAERRRCNHHDLEEPLSELDCLLSVVGSANKHKYVVCSQDLDVRKRMREIPGVPLVYIHRSVMILEPMAGSSAAVREAEERSKMRAGLKGRRPVASGDKRKREDDDDDDEDGDEEDIPERAKAIAAAEATELPAQKKRKLKGPKGPNPLSVKKGKKDPPGSQRKPAEEDEERSTLRKTTQSDLPTAHNTKSDSSAEGGLVEAVEERAARKKRKRKPRPRHVDTTSEGGGAGE